jgi:hypothetical protein
MSRITRPHWYLLALQRKLHIWIWAIVALPSLTIDVYYSAKI